MKKLVTGLLIFLAVGAYAQESSTESKTILDDLDDLEWFG